MDLTLCMVVKNEIKNLPEGLGKIRDLLDEVIVVDTGSTDGTQAYLREELGIEPLQTTMQVSTAYSKSPSRNMAIARVRTEWVLSLDADERIAPQVLQFLAAHQPASEEAGFFGLWRNHVAEAPSFDDYKLFLFRRQYRKRGLVHENVQVDIRESGHRARWLKELVVDHFPDPGLHRHKTTFYRQRLEAAVAMDPLWIRHHWFLGYMHFEQGDLEQAIPYLETALYSDHPLFPVERLNSAMVLATILARQTEQEALGTVLKKVSGLYQSVQNDFEVQINRAFAPWLERTMSCWQEGQLAAIDCARFAR